MSRKKEMEDVSNGKSASANDDLHPEQAILPSSYLPQFPALRKTSLPSKLFYSLSEAAVIVKCTALDLLHYAGLSKIRLLVPVPRNTSLRIRSQFSNKEELPTHLAYSHLIELLTIAPDDCRQIELHGEIQQGTFPLGWTISSVGNITPVHPTFNNPPGTMPDHGIWTIFSEDSQTSITITLERLFVFSYDLERFLNGIYQPSDDVQPVLTYEHRSEKLLTLTLAARRFWGGKIDPQDPTTYTSTAEIRAWLEGQGFSKGLAKSGASIIRPDFAGHGGRPPTK